jgi:NAD(P)-dependent dehydrogenase (short-subunit alcohol dehydrogenase family)
MNLNIRSVFLFSQAMAKRHDPAPQRPHHQRRQHRRPGRQPAEMKTIAYNTSKGAAINFTRTLAWRVGPTASPSTPSRRASSRAR